MRKRNNMIMRVKGERTNVAVSVDLRDVLQQYTTTFITTFQYVHGCVTTAYIIVDLHSFSKAPIYVCPSSVVVKTISEEVTVQQRIYTWCGCGRSVFCARGMTLCRRIVQKRNWYCMVILDHCLGMRDQRIPVNGELSRVAVICSGHMSVFEWDRSLDICRCSYRWWSFGL